MHRRLFLHRSFRFVSFRWFDAGCLLVRGTSFWGFRTYNSNSMAPRTLWADLVATFTYSGYTQPFQRRCGGLVKLSPQSLPRGAVRGPIFQFGWVVTCTPSKYAREESVPESKVLQKSIMAPDIFFRFSRFLGIQTTKFGVGVSFSDHSRRRRRFSDQSRRRNGFFRPFSA